MTFKTKNYSFFINLNKNQSWLYQKTFQNLDQEWISIPKNKQKLYYKLYWNLLKSKILQDINLKKTEKKKWTYEKYKVFSKLSSKLHYNNDKINYETLNLLNSSFFYKKVEYNKFREAKLKGYTIHNEKILNFENKSKITNILYNYKNVLKSFYIL